MTDETKEKVKRGSASASADGSAARGPAAEGHKENGPTADGPTVKGPAADGTAAPEPTTEKSTADAPTDPGTKAHGNTDAPAASTPHPFEALLDEYPLREPSGDPVWSVRIVKGWLYFLAFNFAWMFLFFILGLFYE